MKPSGWGAGSTRNGGRHRIRSYISQMRHGHDPASYAAEQENVMLSHGLLCVHEALGIAIHSGSTASLDAPMDTSLQYATPEAHD